METAIYIRKETDVISEIDKEEKGLVNLTRAGYTEGNKYMFKQRQTILPKLF